MRKIKIDAKFRHAGGVANAMEALDKAFARMGPSQDSRVKKEVEAVKKMCQKKKMKTKAGSRKDGDVL